MVFLEMFVLHWFCTVFIRVLESKAWSLGMSSVENVDMSLGVVHVLQSARIHELALCKVGI